MYCVCSMVVQWLAAELSEEEINVFVANDKITLCDVELTLEDVKV